MASIAFLGIEIKGTKYGVQILSAVGSGNRVVRLSKDDGTSYDVEQGSERTTCDCPDWKKRHADLPYSDGCKHVRALVECGLVENAHPFDQEPEPEMGTSGAWYMPGEIEAEVEAAREAAQRLAAGTNEIESTILVAQAKINDLWYRETGRIDSPTVAELNVIDARPDGTFELDVDKAVRATEKRLAGRKPQAGDWHSYGQRYQAGEPYRTLAREAGCSPTMLYNRVKKLGYGRVACNG